MLNEKQISNLLFDKLSYAYCDNCGSKERRKQDMIENPEDYDMTLEEAQEAIKVDMIDSPCEWCHRKYNSWSLSRDTADWLAKEIVNGKQKEKT